MELITQSNVMFVLGLIGIGYAVFINIFGPQKTAESNDLLMDQKANFLREENDKRFEIIDKRLNDLAKDNQNHLHTIEDNVKTLTGTVSMMRNSITKLETIIQERIPQINK